MTSYMNDGGSMRIRFPDRCLKFGNDGVEDYVTAPNSQHIYIPSGSKLSLSCWYKHNNAHVTYQGSFANIIGKHPTYNWGIGFVTSQPPHIMFHQNFAEASGFYGAGEEKDECLPMSGTWVHYCGVYNGGDRTGGNKYGSIYVNGELVETALYVSGITEEFKGTDSKFVIGWNGASFSGCIYDIRVWSGCALTADEVELVYKGFEDVQKDKLVLWYKCNDRKGSTLDDSSGNGLDGAITGATWDDVTMDCWATRFDETDYSVICETFLTAGQRNMLFNSVTPGIIRELKSILGKPWYLDGTFSNRNTIRLEPVSGYGLSGVRTGREICVKNVQDSFITPDVFSIKVEGYRTKSDTG